MRDNHSAWPGPTPRHAGSLVRGWRSAWPNIAVVGVVLALPLPLPAQTLVVPPAFATLDASGGTNVPFGRPVPMRVQQAYAGLLFGGATVISGVAFRADANSAAFGKRAEVEIRMSTMAWSVTAIQRRFAANPGADETVVLDRTTLNLPPLTAVAAVGFELQIPLDRSFSYDSARGSLLLEIRVYSQDPGSYKLDATYLCNSPQQPFGPPGCGALRVTVPTRQVLWGWPVFFQISNASQTSTTGLFLGLRESGSWNGQQLPISLTPYGAPGCYLSLDVVWMMAATPDGTGTVTTSLNIPSIPTLQNQWIRYQGFSFDRAANPLGALTSQAGKVQVCGWEPVSRVFAPDVTAVAGAREIGVSPVLGLVVQ